MSGFRKTHWWAVAPLLSPALLGAFGVACSSGSDRESLATSQQQLAPPPPMRAKIGVRATTMTVKGGNPYLNVWHEFDVTIGGERTTRAGYLFECGGGGGVFGWSGTSGSCPFSDLPAATYNYPDEMNSCPTSCVPSIARWQANSYKSMILDPVPASVPINIKIPVVGNSFNSNRTISFDLALDPVTGVVTPEPQGTWDQDITDLTDSCVTVDWIPGEWTLCWEVEVDSLDPPAPAFERAAGGARLLTAAQYRRTVAQLLGADAANAAIPPQEPVVGVIAAVNAFERPVDRVAAVQYEKSALAAAGAAVQSPARLAEHAPCVTQGPVDAAFRQYCYGEVAHRIGFLAWRLPLSADAKNRLIEIAQLAEAESTTDADKLKSGVKYLIATILESASFVYSVEVGEPESPTVRNLNDFELASRLALFLQGSYPSEDLINLAAQGALSTTQGIRAVASALLSSSSARDGFNDQIDELFQVKVLPSRGKDAATYSQFTQTLKDAMREEVQRFVNDITFDSPRSFLSVLTEERRFVNAELAQSVYGITPPASGWGLVDFSTVAPDQKRAGIMTMPGILAMSSHAVQNSIVRRGNFASAFLFCQEAPPVPRGVDTTIPSVTPGTLRDFMEATTEAVASCRGCHLTMNGLGYAFENFDAIGRFRTTETPVKPNLAVNPSVGSTFVLFDGVTQFGSYADARGWAGNAASLAQLVSRCWVDQVYRNAVGATAGPGQDAVLDGIDQTFETSGHLMQTLLLEFVASPAFRQVGPPR